MVLTNFPVKLFQVIISCTFTDFYNRTRSCVERSREVPLVKIYKQDCDEVIGNVCRMNSHITFEVCNRNPSQEIHPKIARSKIRTSALGYVSFQELINEGNAAVAQPIQPNQCVTLLDQNTVIDANKPVDKKGAHKYPLEIVFEGNMPQLNVETSFCYGQIHARNLMKLFPTEVKDDPTFYASDPAPVPNPQQHPGGVATSVSDANVIYRIFSFITTHLYPDQHVLYFYQ